MRRPLIIVSGMGRCGTSLVMQMLAAAGIHCTGLPPAYEDKRTSFSSFDGPWLAQLQNAAVKILDPANLPELSFPDCPVIWLDRNPREQARSQLKFLSIVGEIGVSRDRHTVRALEANLRRSRARHRSAVGLPGGLGLTLAFEDIVGNPKTAAIGISEFLRAPGYDLQQHIHAMAEQVVPRSPRCLEGLLELELLLTKEDEIARMGPTPEVMARPGRA